MDINVKRTLTLLDILREVTPDDLHLVGKTKHEIFNIPKLMPPNVKIDIKLQLSPSNFIFLKVLTTIIDVTVSLTLEILHVQIQQVMSSVALSIDKLRANGSNIKLFVPHIITNQHQITTGSRTYADSSFINGEIPSNLALAFVNSANAVGSWTNSPQKFEMFGLSNLLRKLTGIPP